MRPVAGAPPCGARSSNCCASLGAIWSSCSPDIGAGAVLDRVKQIEPKVLFTVDGYVYNGKPNDRRDVVAELIRSLPTLQHAVLILYLFHDPLKGPSAHEGHEGLKEALLRVSLCPSWIHIFIRREVLHINFLPGRLLDSPSR